MTEIYTLPELPYSYDALEPWCAAETLHLHHDKHHAAYVRAANDASEVLASIDPTDTSGLFAAQSALTFNLGGHVLHSLFWTSLAPESTRPTDSLQRMIEADFGDYDRLCSLLATTCKNVQGTGWGALVYDATAQRLRVTPILDHQQDHAPNAAVLAVIDVWEHAYYLGYRSDKVSWVKAVIEHLDWVAIGVRCDSVAGATAEENN